MHARPYPQPGEIDTNNHWAQENVFSFDSGGASSQNPVRIDAAVRSPFTIHKRVDLMVRGLPYGWHAVVDHRWVWTGPKGERSVRAVVWTDLHALTATRPKALRRHQHIEAAEALVRVEGWTTLGDRYLPIGGLLAHVKVNRKVRMAWEVSGSPCGGLVGRVWVLPALADVPITVLPATSAWPPATTACRPSSRPVAQPPRPRASRGRYASPEACFAGPQLGMAAGSSRMPPP